MCAFKKYKIYILSVLLCILSLFVGFVVSYFMSRPERIAFDGEAYNLKNRYILNVWYYEDGELSEISIRDKLNKKMLIENSIFYPSGVLKAYFRRIPKGSVFTSYTATGKIQTKKYKSEVDQTSFREYCSEDGNIINVKDLNSF